jgi:hypothetical protein
MTSRFQFPGDFQLREVIHWPDSPDRLDRRVFSPRCRGYARVRTADLTLPAPASLTHDVLPHVHL